MSKPIFVVSFEREKPVYVRADRMAVSEGRLFFFEYGHDEHVAKFTEFTSVSLEARPGPSEPCAAPLAGVEPVRLSAGVASYFSSPASPLVEAIDSVARLVTDLEMLDRATFRPVHLTPLGDLSRHLNALLDEQRAQLCAPVGRARV